MVALLLVAAVIVLCAYGTSRAINLAARYKVSLNRSTALHLVQSTTFLPVQAMIIQYNFGIALRVNTCVACTAMIIGSGLWPSAPMAVPWSVAAMIRPCACGIARQATASKYSQAIGVGYGQWHLIPTARLLAVEEMMAWLSFGMHRQDLASIH